MTAVHALVLAGGQGARFGGGKLLAPWRGGILLDGALGRALGGPFAGVTVVTGAHGDAVAAACRRFDEAHGGKARMTIVHARDHAEGLAASLRAGIGALPASATGALVFLGDMPLVPAGVLAPLVEALLAGAPAAAPVFDGREGHPVALSRALFGEVLALTGDRGARRIVESLGAAVTLVPTDDPGVLVDVDRPEDLPR